MSRPTNVMMWAMAWVLAMAPGIRGADKAGAGIIWLDSFDTAVATAQAQDKPVLLEFHSDGCAWCKMLEKHVHPYGPAAAMANERFVAVRLKGPAALRERFGARGNPAIRVIDPHTGRSLFAINGYPGRFGYVRRLSDAAAEYRMVRAAPELAEAWADFADLRSASQWKQASEALERLAADDRLDRPIVLTQLAQCRFEAYEHEAALAAAEQAVAIGGAQDTVARYVAAASCISLGRYKQASPLIESIFDAPMLEDGWYETSLAWVCRALAGDRAGADAMVNQRLRQVKQSGYVWYDRDAVDYLIGGRRAEALLQRAGKNRYQQAHARYLMAAKAWADGDRAQAAEQIRRCTGDNLRDYDVRHLAMALRDMIDQKR